MNKIWTILANAWTYLVFEECKEIGGSKLFVFYSVFQKPGFYFKTPVTTLLLKHSNLIFLGGGGYESYIYMWIYLRKYVNSTVPDAFITVNQHCWFKSTKSATNSHPAILITWSSKQSLSDGCLLSQP